MDRWSRPRLSHHLRHRLSLCHRRCSGHLIIVITPRSHLPQCTSRGKNPEFQLGKTNQPLLGPHHNTPKPLALETFLIRFDFFSSHAIVPRHSFDWIQRYQHVRYRHNDAHDPFCLTTTQYLLHNNQAYDAPFTTTKRYPK